MILLHPNSNPPAPPPTSPVFSMLVKIIIINQEHQSNSWKSFLIPSILSLQIPASYPTVLLQNIYFHIYISVYSAPCPSSKLPPLTTGISEMVFYPCHPHHFALYIEQSGCFRSIHIIRLFFYFKPLILLIAPREVQRLHPGQQGKTEQITAYLLDFYCILTLVTMLGHNDFIFLSQTCQNGCRHTSFVLVLSLIRILHLLPGSLPAGSFPSLKAQFNYAYLQNPFLTSLLQLFSITSPALLPCQKMFLFNCLPSSLLTKM